MVGSEFEKRVWRAIASIPKGRVTSYGAIAKYLGTKGVRAVGNAVGKNPYAPEIPCHRVVRSDGQIGGYSAKGGIDEKISLLESEGIDIRGGKVMDFETLYWKFGESISEVDDER
jgi:O-6-methylguanine DNA methyltransferase